MSYDRKLDQLCPHTVVGEALYLSLDRTTVRPLRPIAGISTVKVRINGEFEVPSPGYVTPAQVTGTKAGPFNIQGGASDRLVIQVDASTQVLTIPSGKNLPISQMLNLINRSAQGVTFFATPKQQVRITSSKKGPGATIKLLAGSTAAPIFGLSVDRVWRGQTVTPGWSVINDPNTLADRPTRLIIFDTPLKGNLDFIELDYTTIRQECRRCGGLGVENDWRYDGQGQVTKVRDLELLRQEILKLIYTVQGSNAFHTWYGTSVINSIGKKLSSTGIVQNMILSDITEAFRRWQTVKRQQEEVVGQIVSDAEYPFRISSVNLQQSTQDPTVIFVQASIQTRSNQIVDIERGVKAPLPVNLMGSNQQSELIQQSLPNYNLIQST